MRRTLLVAAVLVLLGTTGCFPGLAMVKHPQAFNSRIWKSVGMDQRRCDMVDDLHTRVGVVGRTRSELIALLGEPEADGQGGDHYHLCLSLADVWILEVDWKDGRVASTSIRDT